MGGGEYSGTRDELEIEARIVRGVIIERLERMHRAVARWAPEALAELPPVADVATLVDQIHAIGKAYGKRATTDTLDGLELVSHGLAIWPDGSTMPVEQIPAPGECSQCGIRHDGPCDPDDIVRMIER